MSKYLIEITEVLQKRIHIDANSLEEALSKAKALYQEQEIILDDTNHIETKFNIIR